MKEIDGCSGGGTGRSKGELIMKQIAVVRMRESRIEVVFDD